MKNVSIYRVLRNSFFVALCMFSATIILSSCGDDDEKIEKEIPSTLYQQWIGNGSGTNVAKVVFDLRKKGIITVLQQPTSSYAAQTGMNVNNFYTAVSQPISYELDNKTGKINIMAGSLTMLTASNVTKDHAKFNDIDYQAVSGEITSSGTWVDAEQPL